MKVIISENNVRNVLTRLWEKDPYYDTDKLKMFGISGNHQQVQKWFQDFIGEEEMIRRAKEIVPQFVGQEITIQECGTYIINFKINRYFIEEGWGNTKYVYYVCDIDNDKSSAAIPWYDPDAERRPLSQIFEWDSVTEWEIQNEIRECIEEYFAEKTDITKITGMTIVTRTIHE